MSFRNEVKIALIQKGWTQRQLAKEMDISIAYLQDIFKGNRKAEARRQEIRDLLGMEKEGQKTA